MPRKKPRSWRIRKHALLPGEKEERVKSPEVMIVWAKAREYRRKKVKVRRSLWVSVIPTGNIYTVQSVTRGG